MRPLVTPLLALLVVVAACKPNGSREITVTHSVPVFGMRVVDITNRHGDHPVALRFSCGSSFSTWKVSEALRIVVVEDLGGKCGVYIQQQGATTRRDFEVPTLKIGGQVAKTVTASSPTGADISAGRGDVLRIEWPSGDDSLGKPSAALTLRFALLYE